MIPHIDLLISLWFPIRITWLLYHWIALIKDCLSCTNQVLPFVVIDKLISKLSNSTKHWDTFATHCRPMTSLWCHYSLDWVWCHRGAVWCHSGVALYYSGVKWSYDVIMTSLVMSLLVVVARTWGIPSIPIRTLNMYKRCTVAHLEP